MIDGPTPREIVTNLDKYIVGQDDAKFSVAIAIRNRARRRALPVEMQEEIYPKNIMMIGPTGVGKTEIARRLAKLTDAPFLKVEASKFTEVGYVGRDVESMIRDLVEMAINNTRDRRIKDYTETAEKSAEEKILDQLVPLVPRPPVEQVTLEWEDSRDRTREKFREKLKNGELEDRTIEPELEESPVNLQMHAIGIPAGMGGSIDSLGTDLKDTLERIFPKKKSRKRLTVAEARPLLIQQELDRIIDMDTISKDAIERVEQSGIVFLDEIDKIVGAEGGSGPDVSREGVQRDLLPLVEGTTVFTKYGPVRTDHVLFIAAGAFHSSKPSDLIPELQGRFPIRVELDSLGREELAKILVEPENSLIRQYTALIGTEGIDLKFTDQAIETLADLAARINDETEDIGARRLHTIMEKVLEDISFEAPDSGVSSITIDTDYVKEKLEDIITDTDLSRYIL